MRLWCGVKVCEENASRLKIVGTAIKECIDRKHPEWSQLPQSSIPNTNEGILYCEAKSYAAS